jgi:hypothetical protein
VIGKVTHYFPDAMVVFVKGFQQNTPKGLDYIVASNLGDVKEISNINVTLTVKNSPGTFSLTLVDTANKFIVPDLPKTEVATLFRMSNRKIASSTRRSDDATNASKGNSIEVIGGNSSDGNYYNFQTYEDWLNFEYGVLEEVDGSKMRYPIYYINNSKKGIFERFAFDQYGYLIKVVKKDSAQGESDFKKVVSGSVQPYIWFSPDFPKGKLKNYTVWKYRNSDFLSFYKDVEEQGDNVYQFNRGRCRISPMDRVIIFMSERFGEGDYTDPNTRRKLTRVFTGLVNTVQQGYSENQSTVSVQGEDVTKYMRLSVLNVNPGLPLDSTTMVDSTSGDNIQLWADVFKGLDAPSIVKALFLGNGAEKQGEYSRNKITPISQYTLGNSGSRANYKYDPNLGSFVEGVLPKERRSGDSIIDFSAALGKLFTKDTVHIINPFVKGSDLAGFRSYELALKDNWSFYQADFKTRREIAYSIAEETNFLFYANRFGEVWFHPPRYNNIHILGASNPNIYVIDTDSIMSYGFIEDDSQIYTSVYVSTTPAFGMEEVESLGMYIASFRDDGMVLKYGQRLFPTSNPLINASSDVSYNKAKEVLQLYGKSLLQKLCAGRFQGQVTIVGRTELDPGYPVYIPIRNMIYFVETVEHSFSYNGQFTTTLSLSYGHKPWELVPEILTFSANDEVYSTYDAFSSTSGQSTKEKDDQRIGALMKDNSTDISNQLSYQPNYRNTVQSRTGNFGSNDTEKQ